MTARRLRAGLLAGLWLATSLCAAHAEDGLARPAADDYSRASLARHQRALLAAWGGDPRQIPLEAKARHFEWLLWRYHLAPWQQVQPSVSLPERAGEPVGHLPGADVSTWNGALLAALSHRFAATGDPHTLERIETLLAGLSLFQEVTGVPGLAARCVLESDVPVYKVDRPWRAPDGRLFHWRGNPAKGTYTQLTVGYATLAVHALDALPAAARERARRDSSALAGHLVRGGWRIRDARGEPTKYGDLRPRLGPLAIPFQAQVAWLLAATPARLPPTDPAQRARLDAERARLRDLHPYWVSPWLPLLHPQRVGYSSLLDANDRTHLMSASYAALGLELDAAAREGRAPDRDHLKHLGSTLRAAASRLPEHRNSLANFMWAATVADARQLEAIVPGRAARDRVRRQAATLLDQGVEQLRRFPLGRLIEEGSEIRGGGPWWADEYRPDNYHWKVEPNRRWVVHGPPTPILKAATDYLHAYWLLRQTGLDRDPALAARHGPVLRRRLPPRAEPH